MTHVGISTACYYPEDTYSAFRHVCDIGAPIAEVFMNSVDELSHESLKRFRDLSLASGTKIVSFHPYTSAFESLLFFSEYRRRIADGLEVYKRFFDGAAYLGARYFVFHGEKSTATFSRSLACDEILLESYSALIETAKSFGLVFTQENVNNHRSHSAVFLSRLRELLPDLRFTFDLKQAYRARVDYREILSVMGDRLVHMHINDFGEHECALPFDGAVNLPEVKRHLNELSYRGDMVIEVYRTCFSGDCALRVALDKTSTLFSAT